MRPTGSGRAGRDSRGPSPGRAPGRITETPCFRAEHHELPRRLVEDNPDVGSLARCPACPETAARGRFDDDAVQIPGLARWED